MKHCAFFVVIKCSTCAVSPFSASCFGGCALKSAASYRTNFRKIDKCKKAKTVFGVLVEINVEKYAKIEFLIQNPQ